MRQFYKIVFSLLLLFAGVQFGYAQKTVSGTVTDSATGEGLFNTTVQVQGMESVGTITDFDGKYSLEVPDGFNTLIFNYLGYEPQTVTIAGSGSTDVKLVESSISLGKVTVTAGRRAERTMDAPASISTVEAKEIQNMTVATAADYLTNISGVDVMKTSLTGTNVVIRGFNNIFSGATLTMVDSRIAAVPSLRVNAQQAIPANTYDIERIEVLKGPASAMYGPNTSNGVVHIITKSPIDLEGSTSTSLSLGGGFRSKIKDTVAIANPANPVFDDNGVGAYTANFRHAAHLTHGKESGTKVGLKISGKYFSGKDWQYDDPAEPDTIYYQRQSIMGLDSVAHLGVPAGTPVFNERAEDAEAINLEGRLDFRFNKDTELILSGGYSNFSGVELTGLGASQPTHWAGTFGQIRFIWKDLFVQAYRNSTNSGDTYFYRDGNLVVDKSALWSTQIQHSSSLFADRVNLVYGLDALLTRPDTEETINGNFETDDNIDEIGLFLQADADLIKNKLNLIAALRADRHSYVDDIFLSPRAALVYKPNINNTFRATYNRSFSSPSALNLSLDLLVGEVIPGMGVRGFGNRDGFTYSRSDSGLPQFRSPFSAFTGAPTSTFYDLNDSGINNTLYSFIVDQLTTGLKEIAASLGSPLITPELVQGVVDAIVPTEVSVTNDIRAFTQDLSSPFGEVIDPATIDDFGGIVHSTNQTYEFGYKGIIKQKLAVTADLYFSRFEDFVTPLVVQTPNVFINPASLAADLGPKIAANMAANPGEAFIINAVLDTLQTTQGIDVNGNGDGSGLEELVTLLTSATAQVPFGVISPDHVDNSDILLVYQNFGTVDVWGFEIGADYYVNQDFKVSLDYNFINEDEFESDGYAVALNSPKHRAGLGLQYASPKIGLSVGSKVRVQSGFPVNSGVYVGEIDGFGLWDVNIGYALPFSKQTTVSMTMQNVLNNVHQEFVGSPQMGRFTMFQIAHTLNTGGK